VGLHLELTAAAPADVNTLEGVTQSLLSLSIGVYQRRQATIQSAEESVFDDSYPKGNFYFDEDRVIINFASSNPEVPAVDLDLVHGRDGSWEGRLHRGEFNAKVKLQRPGARKLSSPNAMSGTWLENKTDFLVGSSCVHIAQQSPTEWTGWADFLTVLGDNMEYPPGVARPATTEERYGNLMKVEAGQNHSISFVLGAYSGICCASKFVGATNAEGTLIEGDWVAGPNQLARVGSWKKMSGHSCRVKDVR
jgi:hypothetical protein